MKMSRSSAVLATLLALLLQASAQSLFGSKEAFQQQRRSRRELRSYGYLEDLVAAEGAPDEWYNADSLPAAPAPAPGPLPSVRSFSSLTRSGYGSGGSGATAYASAVAYAPVPPATYQPSIQAYGRRLQESWALADEDAAQFGSEAPAEWFAPAPAPSLAPSLFGTVGVRSISKAATGTVQPTAYGALPTAYAPSVAPLAYAPLPTAYSGR